MAKQDPTVTTPLAGINSASTGLESLRHPQEHLPHQERSALYRIPEYIRKDILAYQHRFHEDVHFTLDRLKEMDRTRRGIRDALVDAIVIWIDENRSALQPTRDWIAHIAKNFGGRWLAFAKALEVALDARFGRIEQKNLFPDVTHADELPLQPRRPATTHISSNPDQMTLFNDE